MGYAFISYSTKEQSSADTMKKLLENQGVQTWMAPGDIPAGSKYAQVINKAVKECSCFILMLSENSQNSVWVAKEVERAINYRKPIIPVQLEDLTLNDEFELYISTDQVVAVQKIDENSPDVQKILTSAISITGTSEDVIQKKPSVLSVDNPDELKETSVKDNYENHNADLAWAYINKGNSYYSGHLDLEEAEYYYTNAITIYEQLAQDNPERYDADLAMSYNYVGIFYNDQSKPEQAEYYYTKAIEIYEQLAKDDPERFNLDLARLYKIVGDFYDGQCYFEKAELYYTKAIELYEQLAKDKPERFNSNLAEIYNTTGVFSFEQYNNGEVTYFRKAEYHFTKAIETYEQLANSNPERYNAGLADSCYYIGWLYNCDQCDVEKAEYYHTKAIETYEQLAKDNPERYNAYLADSYRQAGVFYKNQGDAEKVEFYYIKAIELYEQLAKGKHIWSVPKLANIYYEYGSFTNDNQYFVKALELAKTQPDDDLYCKDIISVLEN